jgi:hypothetical protein
MRDRDAKITPAIGFASQEEHTQCIPSHEHEIILLGFIGAGYMQVRPVSLHSVVMSGRVDGHWPLPSELPSCGLDVSCCVASVVASGPPSVAGVPPPPHATRKMMNEIRMKFLLTVRCTARSAADTMR